MTFKGVTNVILLKVICWFYGWQKLPKEDDAKMLKLVNEFIKLETDDRGFAKRSTPAQDYIDEEMTLEEFRKNRRNIVNATQRANWDLQNHYGMLFHHIDEFTEAMEYRHLLPNEYQDKYAEWVKDGKKDISVPPRGYEKKSLGKQKKKKKKKKAAPRLRLQDEEEPVKRMKPQKRTRRKLTYDDHDSDIDADAALLDAFHVQQERYREQREVESSDTPTKLGHFPGFDLSPLPTEEKLKWKIAEVVDCDTKDDELAEGKFHSIRVLLEDGTIITQSLDMLHRFAKDSDFLKKQIMNKEMFGLRSVILDMENRIVTYKGFPKEIYNKSF